MDLTNTRSIELTTRPVAPDIRISFHPVSGEVWVRFDVYEMRWVDGEYKGCNPTGKTIERRVDELADKEFAGATVGKVIEAIKEAFEAFYIEDKEAEQAEKDKQAEQGSRELT